MEASTPTPASSGSHPSGATAEPLAEPAVAQTPASNAEVAVDTTSSACTGLATAAPVLVTGASGFIALHTIKQLLERGYRVRGTVRSLKDKSKNEPLTSLPHAAERLELVEADLNKPESFIPAVAGVEYVLHIASPYVLNVTDAQKDLVDPAVNGTVSVLQAAYDAGTVKRVVLTSSCAAISDSFDPSKVYTEADWNEMSSLTRNPYYYSKTLAEKAAWKFVEEKSDKFDLVVINPFIVLGPALIPTQINESVHFYKQLLNGEMSIGGLDLYFGIVDVRDVALAHITAMETPTAKGRYICWNKTLPMKEAVEIMRSRLPAYARRLPTRQLPNFVVNIAAYFKDRGTKDFLHTNLGGLNEVPSERHMHCS
jgi:dihydroflavonol-4-reductase